MHVIRLRGPWEVESRERYVPRGDDGYGKRTGEALLKTRSQMPADWCAALGADYLGLVRYRRNFNRPTNLEPRERVWLVVEPPRSCGLVRLNDHELGRVPWGEPPGRFDITSLLKDYNALVIDVSHPELDDEGRALDQSVEPAAGGLVGEVRLEIDD